MLPFKSMNRGTKEAAMVEEEKGFVIKDKRMFSQETGEATPEASPEATTAEEKPTKEERASQTATSDEEMQLPEVNFATFIFSLSSSAMLHFGEIPDPATGTKKTNLPMAKHTIDILGMLEEKTKGNLTSDEGELLKSILYDLRMRYVKKTS
jgi:hypothetical protein